MKKRGQTQSKPCPQGCALWEILLFNLACQPEFICVLYTIIKISVIQLSKEDFLNGFWSN